MSLNHKNVHQIYGEFLCTHCGKSWAADDRDPPACTEEPAEVETGLRYQGSTHGSSGPHKLPPQNLPRTDPYGDIDRAVGQAQSEGKLRRAEVSGVFASPYGTAPMEAYLIASPHASLTTVLGYARSRELMESLVASAFADFKEAPHFTVTRYGRMDTYAHGISAYFELNPRIIEEARRVPTHPGCEHSIQSVGMLYRALTLTNKGRKK